MEFGLGMLNLESRARSEIAFDDVLAKCFFQKIQEHLRAFQEGTIGSMD